MAVELLEYRFYHNPLAAWLVAGAIGAVVAVVLLVARGVLARRVERIAARTATRLDDIAVDVLRTTRLYFVIVVALAAASLSLDLPAETRAALRILTVIAAALQAGVWGNGLVASLLNGYAARRAAEGETTSAATVQAFGALARIFVWALIGLVTVDNLGYKVGTLITGLGITGIAVALAVQSTLGDLFGALSIVVDKPFVIGDSIAVDNFNGTVEYIGLKTTRLRSLSGEQLVFSNSDLLKSRIRNFRRQQERRQLFVTRLRQDTPPALVARVPGMLRAIVERREQVRFDRSHFTTIGDTSLDVETVYFMTTADYQAFMDAQQAINLEILETFAREGIRLSVPLREVVGGAGVGGAA